MAVWGISRSFKNIQMELKTSNDLFLHWTFQILKAFFDFSEKRIKTYFDLFNSNKSFLKKFLTNFIKEESFISRKLSNFFWIHQYSSMFFVQQVCMKILHVFWPMSNFAVTLCRFDSFKIYSSRSRQVTLQIFPRFYLGSAFKTTLH